MSTTHEVEVHHHHSQTDPPPDPTAQADTPEETAPPSNHKTIIIVSVVIALLVIAGLLIGLFIWKPWKKKHWSGSGPGDQLINACPADTKTPVTPIAITGDSFTNNCFTVPDDGNYTITASGTLDSNSDDWAMWVTRRGSHADNVLSADYTQVAQPVATGISYKPGSIDMALVKNDTICATMFINSFFTGTTPTPASSVNGTLITPKCTAGTIAGVCAAGCLPQAIVMKSYTLDIQRK